MKRSHREILSALGRDWTFVGITGGGHLRWRHHTGAVIHTSSTPRVLRFERIRADARRQLRQR